VAAFSKVVLELLAAGAPSTLVEKASSALTDEIAHAKLSFAIARLYAGESQYFEPSKFPLTSAGSQALVESAGDRTKLASSTAREGCIEETLSAIDLTEKASRADDALVRDVLVSIARDEARHAGLAWATVAWALREDASIWPSVVESFESGLKVVQRNQQGEAAEQRRSVGESVLAVWVQSIGSGQGLSFDSTLAIPGLSPLSHSLLLDIVHEFDLISGSML